MTKSILNTVMLFALVAMFGCKSSNSGTSGNDSLGNKESVKETTYAVCLWDKVALKESPDAQGKWLASIALGEKCTYLDQTKEDNTGTKTVTYYKIRLMDGKEGWAQSDLISLDSKPAALTQDADIYSRPDLLTKTNRSFSKMDIVAVKSTQNDFIEVIGKRKEGKWIESGWIKANNVSYADVDIAVAKFASKALMIEDKEKRIQALNDIVGNTDFGGSVFIDYLTNLATEGSKLEGEDVVPVDSLSEQ